MMAMKVPMITVNSSNADSVGYDKTKKELFVKFRGGATYKYSKVPEIVFKSLLEAESFGQMLNERVKGKYGYEKVTK